MLIPVIAEAFRGMFQAEVTHEEFTALDEDQVVLDALGESLQFLLDTSLRWGVSRAAPIQSESDQDNRQAWDGSHFASNLGPLKAGAWFDPDVIGIGLLTTQRTVDAARYGSPLLEMLPKGSIGVLNMFAPPPQ